MMKIRAVLFDLDNTLVDFVGMKRKASKAAAYAMVEAGLKEDRDLLAKDLFEFYLWYWIEADNAFEEFLKKKYGKADVRVLAAGVNAYLKEKYLHLYPYPGVKETLTELKKKGLKLAVVSDGTRLKAWMRLNEAGIDRFFDIVVTHEDTCKKKPCKEPFLSACERLEVRPEECLFIGDWPERDIAGAKAVGMKTVLARYGLVASDDGTNKADYEIKEIKDVLEIINEELILVHKGVMKESEKIRSGKTRTYTLKEIKEVMRDKK